MTDGLTAARYQSRPETTTGSKAVVTLLESEFPAREISLVAQADRRATDPVYASHRWWARRPPALLRSILLAGILPASASPEDFWAAYVSPSRPLEGLWVCDPFAGGGSTLIEAARLGANVVGTDIDPMAVQITRHELRPAPPEEVRMAGRALLRYLTAHLGHLYPSDNDQTPLHYFWIHVVTCPSCGESGPLYRNLILARDSGKPGAVVRDEPLTVFDPDDFMVHHLNRHDRMTFDHEQHRYRIEEGTFRDSRYHCPCGHRSWHRELQTGLAPRRLLAVEVTRRGGRRRVQAAVQQDHEAISAATDLLGNPLIPMYRVDIPLTEVRQDPRPLSYGIRTFDQMFTDRQLLVLGSAQAWINTTDLRPQVAAALTLALSNALATNNKLCSYATDYGRLSALFSVRGYSIPSLAVELNPLHPDGGRGTIRQCINRVVRAASTEVRRYHWDIVKQRPDAVTLSLPTTGTSIDLRHEAATAMNGDREIDLCVFDPPYFDYIAYDELSELYRAWQGGVSLDGVGLHPDRNNPIESFGAALADCLRPVLARLKPGRPLAFTYHSANPSAWTALGIALDDAKLRVTALWPVRSDGHMGHHSHAGNCEWDIVIVCRPISEVTPAKCPDSVENWVDTMSPLKVNDADRASMALAVAMADKRFARPPGAEEAPNGRS